MAGPQPTLCENGHGLRHGRRRPCGRRHGQLEVGPCCGRVAQIGQYNICVGSFCGRVAQIGQSPTQFGQPLRKRGFLDVVLKGAIGPGPVGRAQSSGPQGRPVVGHRIFGESAPAQNYLKRGAQIPGRLREGHGKVTGRTHGPGAPWAHLGGGWAQGIPDTPDMHVRHVQGARPAGGQGIPDMADMHVRHVRGARPAGCQGIPDTADTHVRHVGCLTLGA